MHIWTFFRFEASHHFTSSAGGERERIGARTLIIMGEKEKKRVREIDFFFFFFFFPENVFSAASEGSGGRARRSAEEVERELGENDDIEWAQLQVPLARDKRGFYSDPSYPLQWHLVPFFFFIQRQTHSPVSSRLFAKVNDGQTGSPAGHDINVLPVWEQGITGVGVTVAMVDDGLDYTHDDLAMNFVNSLFFHCKKTCAFSLLTSNLIDAPSGPRRKL